MRVLRPLAWATILVACFIYVTSHWDLSPVRSASRLWSEPASAASGYNGDEQNNIDIYKASADAVVNITSHTNVETFFGVYPQEGTGSGFFVNPDGQILTNYHVVKGATTLTVRLSDKKEYKARVLAHYPADDLALLKIDAPRKLPVLHLGESENLMVGQKVLAIGNPFGLQNTLTTGIVSSLDREIQTDPNPNAPTLAGMIQTDAAINPGNSGGPLLDSHGNVIGINTAIQGNANIGIGFAMPIARAKSMLDEYQKTGKISLPAPIGILTAYVYGDLAEELKLPASGGLLVQRVDEGSAADLAGIRGPTQRVFVGMDTLYIGGDLITTVEGQPVTGNITLTKALARKRGGDTLDVTVYRNGKNVDVKIHLKEAGEKI